MSLSPDNSFRFFEDFYAVPSAASESNDGCLLYFVPKNGGRIFDVHKNRLLAHIECLAVSYAREGALKGNVQFVKRPKFCLAGCRAKVTFPAIICKKCVDTERGEKAVAKFRRNSVLKPKKAGSIWAVSGGLPSLGKRR